MNTASHEVLYAVFYGLQAVGLIGSGDALSLTNDVRAQRATTPMTDMTCNTGIVSSFYNFIQSRGYLSATEKARVLENADPTNYSWTGADVTTAEFCDQTNSFMITATGQYPASPSPNAIIRTVRVLYGNNIYGGSPVNGTLKIPVTRTEINPSGYWREQ